MKNPLTLKLAGILLIAIMLAGINVVPAFAELNTEQKAAMQEAVDSGDTAAVEAAANKIFKAAVEAGQDPETLAGDIAFFVGAAAAGIQGLDLTAFSDAVLAGISAAASDLGLETEGLADAVGQGASDGEKMAESGQDTPAEPEAFEPAEEGTAPTVPALAAPQIAPVETPPTQDERNASPV